MELYREDGQGHSPPVPGQRWEWHPRATFTMLKDSACRAENAAREVWPDVEMHVGTCHTHASLRWLSNNKALLNPGTSQEHAKIMQRDLSTLKRIPHTNLVMIATDLMIRKWTDELGEELTAKKWSESWGHLNITRVGTKSCDVNPLRGGIPSDNNCVEASNNSDKDDLERTKTNLYQFIVQVDEEIIEPTLRLDVVYQGRLKD
jgi:hypothetical protein